MRIRKEISKTNYQLLVKLIILFTLIFNTVYFIMVYFFPGDDQPNISFWVMYSVIYPIILSSAFIQNFKTVTLFINDYHNVSNFQDKLKARIAKEDLVPEPVTDHETTYRPKTRMGRLFGKWAGSEGLTLRLGEEVTLHGPLKTVTNIEDTLTWNMDFKR
jgi:hypothetical protein